jgi:hypothetical protein
LIKYKFLIFKTTERERQPDMGKGKASRNYELIIPINDLFLHIISTNMTAIIESYHTITIFIAFNAHKIFNTKFVHELMHYFQNKFQMPN